MRRMQESSTKLHNVLCFISGVMAAVLVFVIVVGVKTKAENAGNQNAPSSQAYEPQVISQQTPEESQTEQEKWQEGIISYKGKNYQYNMDIKTFLMMGIDLDDKVHKASDYTKGGQSDALFLLVVNNRTQKLQVISINRNTMTDIELCDEKGTDLGPLHAQICLQHALGDGKKVSCFRTVDVVSKLFGNIPISGYFAMNMGAIPQMNDAVNGVELTVLQNMSIPEKDVKLKKGETVTLDGTEAYYYLRGRDTREFGSATKRLRREEQYIVAYMDQLKKVSAGDPDKVTDVYNAIADYMVSSVDFPSLIEELMNYEFSQNQMYTVPGETVEGEPIDGVSYEEYHVDEDAMQDLIIQIFYEEAEQD